MSGTNGASIEIGQSDQELVGSERKRNYKKYGLIALVLLIVIGIIVVVVIFVTQDNDPKEPTVPTNAISLEDILDNKLYPQRNNATWISDTELLYQDEQQNLVKYNVEYKNITTVLSIQVPLLALAFRYTISPDQRYLMVERSPIKIYRYSFESSFDVVDLSNPSNIYPVQVVINGTTIDRLLLAEWSPNNAIVFVANDRNIYYKPTVTSAAIAITEDGGPVTYNGICDWVYEEEVFSSKTAMWFSPDGSKLAYIQFNDAAVHLMHLQIYGPPGSIQFQYVHSTPIAYPKVGTSNPKVKLLTVNLSGLTASEPIVRNEMLAPEVVRGVDHVLTTVAWQNNVSVISVWMNRIQNQAYLQSCNDSNCNMFKSIVSTDGWVELFNELTVKKDGTQIAIISSQQQGSDGGYRHVTVLSTSNGNEIAVTSGKFVVTEILHWDAVSNFIFYSATEENASQNQHIYAIRAQANDRPQCLTCDMSVDGVKQTYFSAEFSKSGHSLVLTSEGPSIPKVEVYYWEVNEMSQMSIKPQVVWDANQQIHEMVLVKATPKIVHLMVPLSSGFEAKVKLQLPPSADLSGNTKYPMLVYVYAGPNSYNGYDKWEMDYGSYLATNKSIIYAHINGRGSGLRGDKLMHEIYNKFGTVEVLDQIETAKKLPEVLNYIDKENVAIWGWSYGGYAAGMALAKDTENVFKCAASVAPVTDWTYYDSIYTERYMGLPADNPAGYTYSRLSTLAEAFRGKNYFLVHGTLDDNVHYQQSMALARTLEQNDILFKQMSYPDEDHSLFGVRAHLYHSLGRFFAECFHLDKDL